MTQLITIDRATLDQLVVALENSVGAMYEIHHAHTNHRWFTNGEQAAIQHRNLWIRKIPELSKEAIEPITAGREALTNAEPKKVEKVKKREPTIDLGKYAGTYGGYIKKEQS